METKELLPFVLTIVSVGILLGVGLVVLSSFNNTVYREEIGVNTTVTWVNNGSTINIGHGNLTADPVIYNSTSSIVSSVNYTTNLATGVITVNDNTTSCKTGMSCRVIHNYKNYGTEANTALTNATSAVSDISSTWLALIVTVAVLSLILLMVIRSFIQSKR